MKTFALSRLALCAGAAVALLAGCGSQQTGVPAEYVRSDALQYHKTFEYTGKPQSFKVPSGVRSIAVVALGAAGAGEFTSGPHNHPGLGSRVYAVLPVKPRETLLVFVGGAGSVRRVVSTVVAAAEPAAVPATTVEVPPTYDGTAIT